MRFAWIRCGVGWLARCVVEHLVPPHMERVCLAYWHPRGFVSTRAEIYHQELFLGENVYIAGDVLLNQGTDGKSIRLGNKVVVYKHCMLETGRGGSITIGDKSSLHPNVQVKAYVSDIEIGRGVMIAANCALYSYDHGISPDKPMTEQPLEAKGPIVLGDGAWLGTGVIVLSGVRIGKEAVIGAGSVVVKDVPDYGIAVGNPARVIKSRLDLGSAAI